MAKFRIDFWAARFPEEKQWEIYYKIRAMRWTDAQTWLANEFSLSRAPGRQAIYDFKEAMRLDEHDWKMRQLMTAQAEAADIAKNAKVTDEEIEKAYKQLAADIALRTGSAKEAKEFLAMASAIADRRIRAEELALKRAAQETKDSTLALAREKFEAAEKRINAAEGAITAPQLTDAERVARIKEIFGLK